MRFRTGSHHRHRRRHHCHHNRHHHRHRHRRRRRHHHRDLPRRRPHDVLLPYSLTSSYFMRQFLETIILRTRVSESQIVNLLIMLKKLASVKNNLLSPLLLMLLMLPGNSIQ